MEGCRRLLSSQASFQYGAFWSNRDWNLGSHFSPNPTVIENEAGARISLEEYGDLKGKPVFFFHPCPGSRVSGASFNSSAFTHGIRLVCVDRSGVGKSTYKESDSLQDNVELVKQVASALGIDKFGVMSMGGGSPHALAMCFHEPDRVVAAHLLSPIAPITQMPPELTRQIDTAERWTQKLLKFGKLGEFVPGLLFRQARSTVKGSPMHMLEEYKSKQHVVDQRKLSDPALQDSVIDDIQEAFRTSHKGVANDGYLSLRDWGFDLTAVYVPVTLWQGEFDVNSPTALGEWMAARLPLASQQMIRNEGQFFHTKEPNNDKIFREIKEGMKGLTQSRSEESSRKGSRSKR